MDIISVIITLLHRALFLGIGLIGIGFLITIHECGHFLFCKLFNVSTPSFSIGFGPRIWQKKIGETLFSLGAIPLGGYVEIAGSEEVGQGEQKEAKRNDERSFLQKNYIQKTLIMMGGIIFNLAFAYASIIALFSFGIPETPLLFPQNATTIIEKIEQDSPAAQAGLQPKDYIVAVDNTPVKDNYQKLAQTIKDTHDQTLRVSIERNGATITKELKTQDKKPLGITFELKAIKARPFVQAVSDGITATNNLIKNVFRAFKSLFSRDGINNIGGPVMIIAATIQGAQKGFKIFLLLLAYISANLAVLNLLPLPILDGGQVLLYTIEAIVRRQLPDKTKIAIYNACWIGFILLTIYLTYNDIIRIVRSIFAK